MARVKVVSCRPAWITTSNRFTNLFSEAVQNAGWQVKEFSWLPSAVFTPKIILLHWPDELFTAKDAVAHAKTLIKLAVLNAAKHLCGVRLVWLVHETQPHDKGRRAKWSTRAFLKSLDGAIYLSHASKAAGEADIPELKQIPSVVTRHGHYRFDMQHTPQSRRKPGAKVDLLYFGQIRPYKNLDGLIRTASRLSPGEYNVKIVGWSKDPEFTRSLRELAADTPAVTLDIRRALVPQEDLEKAIDESDGVILPYRNILNSGAALFALSRNRPVLAPRLGTLPELRNEVGERWVELYDGDITEHSIRAFAGQLRQPQPPIADLSRYEWAPIGQAIGKFFDQLSQPAERARASRLQSDEARP